MEIYSEPFLAAFKSLESGDVQTFVATLRADPQLSRDRGSKGNTLLNLAVSLAGKPDWQGGLSAIEALLETGCDVDDANDHGWTPLHQAGYSNQPEVARMLLAKGASMKAEARGSGGTPLIMALFWGHREASELLAQHGTFPKNLRVAAGLGDLQLMEACFTEDGALTAEACSAREFYRPHSGFPEWRPSSDPQEVLDEALVWAAKSGRTNVMPRLVQAGARLDADPYRGTPLIWAATRNRTGAAAWLLDHGANVNHKGTFGGASHGQGITALHIAAQGGHLEMVKLLLDRGADRFLQDDLHGSTAESAAEYFGQTAVWEYLHSLAKKGS